MPHSPLGILYVSLVAGDDVNVDMVNTLPGRRSHIDADIVAIRAELLVYACFLLLDDGHAGRHFFRRQVENAGDMPARDDQGVSRARRIRVAGSVDKIMLCCYSLRICAKQAWIIGVSFLLVCGIRGQRNTPFRPSAFHQPTV